MSGLISESNFEKVFALTEFDRDYDGIPDEFDECPQFAETYNKFEDSDGCPDTVSEEKSKFQFPDSDGDGFEDRIDKCVEYPETFNGYLDDDGCPEIIPQNSGNELDSDSDSIADSVDACPNEKETINGFKDADGCPDSLSPNVNSPTFSSEDDGQCRNDKVPVMRITTKEVVCVDQDTAKKWEKYGIVTIVEPISEITNIEPPTSSQEPKLMAPEVIDGESSEITDEEVNISETKTSDVSSVTILETGETIIGQKISYPSGTPFITSKIVTIPVGSETGPHIHEYPLFAYVMKGEVTVDYENEGTKKYVEGDSIMEAINFTHNGINTGNVPTKILVVTLGTK